MRKIKIFFCISVLALCCINRAAFADNLIVPGKSIGSIVIGEQYALLRQRMGKPLQQVLVEKNERVDLWRDGPLASRTQSFFAVTDYLITFSINGRVVQIETSNKKYHLAGGKSWFYKWGKLRQMYRDKLRFTVYFYGYGHGGPDPIPTKKMDSKELTKIYVDQKGQLSEGMLRLWYAENTATGIAWKYSVWTDAGATNMIPGYTPSTVIVFQPGHLCLPDPGGSLIDLYKGGVIKNPY